MEEDSDGEDGDKNMDGDSDGNKDSYKGNNDNKIMDTNSDINNKEEDKDKEEGVQDNSKPAAKGGFEELCLQNILIKEGFLAYMSAS